MRIRRTIGYMPAFYQRDIPWAIKGSAVAADRYTLLTPSGLVANVGSASIYFWTQEEIPLSSAVVWDTVEGTDYTVAANRAGKDFYIYAVVGGSRQILLSANSTYPSGFNANNSRKIGGFHCLCLSVGTISGHTLTGFVTGDILPASIWDLSHRPRCSPEGMVWSEQAKIWVDIYLQSGSGTSTASVFGGTITDSRTWLDFVDDLAAVGKMLLDDAEFQIVAAGSNEETNITGSADPVTTGGHVDTAARRMISNIGVEDACGAMNQWLRDQGYRYGMVSTVFGAASLTCTLYHAAAPGGSPLYVKFGVDGRPYLCSNFATTADKVLTFGTNYKIVIKHDAAAADGLPLYFDYDATLPLRFLVNNTILGKDCYALSNDPNFLLPLKHDASAATNGVAVNYDDGADARLEYISPGAANASMDLCSSGPGIAWYDLPGSKGSLYRQGSYGDAKLSAGGCWADGANCGSRSRYANRWRWTAYTHTGSRGRAEPI